MARTALYAAISGTRNGQAFVSAAGAADEPYTGTAEAALAAAIAVLVADGASPTQAHVNTTNSALTTFLASPAGSVVVSINTTDVTTMNQLRAALRAIREQAESSGRFTL